MAATTLIGTLCIRADADDAMGTGHVMRCLALAQAWRERGGSVVLLSGALPEALAERAAVEGLTVTRIEAAAGSAADAEATLSAARRAGAQWLVLDGYHFAPTYRRALAAGGVRLMVLDDLADTDLGAADVILNQSVYAERAMYPGRVALLLGCEHALLRREFRAIAGSTRAPAAPDARRVLVTLGGSDPDNVAERVATALAAVRDSRLHVQLIVGAANPHLARLRALLPGWREVHDIEILVNPPALPELMSAADLAISAAGGTCWELAALGVPTLLVVIADNQRRNAEALHARGAALSLGDARTAFEGGHATAQIRALLGSSSARQRLSETARRLVDGRGALRVVEALAAHPLQLRRATLDDARTIWEWVNDPATRRASFQSDPIGWEEHRSWFQRRMESADAPAFYIASDGAGQPVGTARFQRDGQQAEISLNLAPETRGRGLGPKLIRKASFQALDAGFCSEVLAWVKADNGASLGAFRRAGFRDCGASQHLGVDSFQFRWDGDP